GTKLIAWMSSCCRNAQSKIPKSRLLRHYWHDTAWLCSRLVCANDHCNRGDFPAIGYILASTQDSKKDHRCQAQLAGNVFHIRQNKHHRWSLDERQVLQYHLGGALHPHIRWWEATDIPRRAIQFAELGDEITLVSLVCEDLAQIDDVAEVIRTVGPT